MYPLISFGGDYVYDLFFAQAFFNPDTEDHVFSEELLEQYPSAVDTPKKKIDTNEQT